MGQKFQCPECEYQAGYKSHLVTHLKTVHRSEKLQCHECEYQATERGRLVIHQKNVHMGENSNIHGENIR